MNDVWAEMGKFSIAHPFLTYDSDGYLWAYFYNGKTTDRTDFHYAKIEV